jgi:hypothetical protein
VKQKISSAFSTLGAISPENQTPEDEDYQENPRGVSGHTSVLTAIDNDRNELYQRREIVFAEEDFPKVWKNPYDDENRQTRHEDCHSDCGP